MPIEIILGVIGVVVTLGVNAVLITHYVGKLSAKVDVTNSQLLNLSLDVNRVRSDVEGMAAVDKRLAVSEERNSNIGKMLAATQRNQERMWTMIDDIRRGKGYIIQDRATLDGEYKDE